ncbi:MAG TPA: DHHA1 domain-containing protein, partial [Acidobacteriaceae bacterium]|nr:DHHA1 domain-containing protein [Acidobacteriaceae bacterium]
ENLFLINIDHHVSGRPFADVNWIDTGASAVAEMIYRLVLAAGARVTREMAACLYTAVLTDTGSFCYEGTGAHTFDLAAALIRCGAQPELVARDVYFSNPLAKMLLLGRALSNLQIDGNLSWLWVTREDMKSTGAEGEDCEGVVNYAIGIEGVQAAVFLRELEEGQIRLSLRSKGRMNVAKIAERFGGGGHENASGCTLPGPLAAAAERILAELRSEIPARRQPGC